MMEKHEDKAGVVDWLKAWANAIRENDVDEGRQLFTEEASGFGTITLATQGLDDLVKRQWTPVWGNTSGFNFDWEKQSFQLSPDALQVVVQTLWSSTGKDEAGANRQRNGRATIILTRKSVTAEWKCTHTHFSMWPGGADAQLVK